MSETFKHIQRLTLLLTQDSFTSNIWKSLFNKWTNHKAKELLWLIQNNALAAGR